MALPPPLGPPEESRNGLISALRLGSHGPASAPPLRFFPDFFCLVPITFSGGCLIFPSFCLDLCNVICFDRSEGEGVEGEVWLLGGANRMGGKTKVKCIPLSGP